MNGWGAGYYALRCHPPMRLSAMELVSEIMDSNHLHSQLVQFLLNLSEPRALSCVNMDVLM